MRRQHDRHVIAPSGVIDDKANDDAAHHRVCGPEIIGRVHHQFELVAGIARPDRYRLIDSSLVIGRHIEHGLAQVAIELKQLATNAGSGFSADRIENMRGDGRHNYSIEALSRLLVVASTIGLMWPTVRTLTQAVLPLASARFIAGTMSSRRSTSSP